MSLLSFKCEWNLCDLRAGFNLSEKEVCCVFHKACGDEWGTLGLPWFVSPLICCGVFKCFLRKIKGCSRSCGKTFESVALYFNLFYQAVELSVGAAQTFADWCPFVVGVAVLKLYTDMKKLVRWETLVYVHAVLVLCFSTWHGKTVIIHKELCWSVGNHFYF